MGLSIAVVGKLVWSEMGFGGHVSVYGDVDDEDDEEED